jgi:hypothetical protein
LTRKDGYKINWLLLQRAGSRQWTTNDALFRLCAKCGTSSACGIFSTPDQVAPKLGRMRLTSSLFGLENFGERKREKRIHGYLAGQILVERERIAEFNPRGID